MSGALPAGIPLSRDYYESVVAPLLARHAPGLEHAAARLGSGSDVLGYDDAQSRDHDWGLRLTLLVEEGHAQEIDTLLAQELPPRFRGLPTRFATTWDPVVRQRVEVCSAAEFATSRLGLDPGSGLTLVDWLSLTGQAVLEVTAGEVFHDRPQALTALRERLEWYPHDVWLYAIAAEFATSRLGLDPGSGLTLVDWLSLTGQAVLEVTAGEVFHDRPQALTALRERLEWYPHDVWLYAIAADWHRLGQELPDVGRAGLRGDEDGSAVIAARHVRTLLHLAHLLHRRWPPYGKWLARSAAALPGGDVVRLAVHEVLRARDWRSREAALADAIELLAAMQGAYGLPTLEPATEAFFDRPHVGLRGMPDLLAEQITDPAVRELPAGKGTAEQISDNVAVLVDAAARRRLVEH